MKMTDRFKDQLHGLYAITTTPQDHSTHLLDQIDSALRGGARIIQYRDKSNNIDQALKTACALTDLCHKQDAILLINDRVDICIEAGADGVHLGAEDTDLKQARHLLGNDKIIGISCYNRIEKARTAAAGGADYLAFGRFYPSITKPGAVQADPQLLSQARREFNLPLVAIGGITPENGGALIRAGADMLAVIHGIFDQPDIVDACRAFEQLFESEESIR